MASRNAMPFFIVILFFDWKSGCGAFFVRLYRLISVNRGMLDGR